MFVRCFHEESVGVTATASIIMLTMGIVLYFDEACTRLLNLNRSLNDSHERLILCGAAIIPVIILSLILMKRLDLLPVAFLAMFSIQLSAYTNAVYTILKRVYPSEFKSSVFHLVSVSVAIGSVLSTKFEIENRVMALALFTVGGFLYALLFGRLKDVIINNKYTSKSYAAYTFEEVYAVCFLALYGVMMLLTAAVGICFALNAICLGIIIYMIASTAFIVLAMNIPSKMGLKRKYGVNFSSLKL